MSELSPIEAFTHLNVQRPNSRCSAFLRAYPITSRVPPQDVGEDKMQQSLIVPSFLFPPHEDAAVAVKPRSNAFDNPATSALAAHSLFGPFLSARSDVRHIAAAAKSLADRVAVVALVEAQMLPTARSRGARQRETIECLPQKFLIVGVGAADRQADRHAAAVGKNRPLDPQLTAIRGVFAGFFPRPGALWSSSHRRFANSSQCRVFGRSVAAFAATPCQTYPVRSSLESNDAPCCRCHTRAEALSTGSQCEGRKRFRPSPADDCTVAGPRAARSRSWVTTVLSAAKTHLTSANSIHEIPSSPASPPRRCK